jgi:hypothetical protein
VTGTRRSSCFFAVFLVGVALLAAAAASAAGGKRHYFDQRCEPVRGICWSTAAEGGHVLLIMESANHGGEFQLCVTPPRGKGACRPVALRHHPPGPHGSVGFVGRVDFEKSFKPAGAGQYLVHWKSVQGFPLGPTLTFRLRANGEPDVPRP